jgi:cysteine desulfurase
VTRLASQLLQEGYEVDRVGVDRDGGLDLDELDQLTRDDTALISIMHANNETGVLFNIQQVCNCAAGHGIRVHIDAVQSVGKLPVDVEQVPVDLLSISAHKMHGPKGVGALYVRRRTRLVPLTTGGYQERGLRPGTENVPAIIGFGVAAEAAADVPGTALTSIELLRNEFEARVKRSIPSTHIIAAGTDRLCNTSNIGFEGFQSDAILLLLSEQGVCASGGSACGSGSLEPSHVLSAMRIDPTIAHGAVRFSMSRFTTASEMERAVDVLSSVLDRLSATMPTRPTSAGV